MTHPGGRPPKYTDPEEMQIIIDVYFLACRANRTDSPELFDDLSEEYAQIAKGIDDIHPTVSGLAYILDMSRQALCDYEKKDEFLDTIKKAKLRIEKYLEVRLYGTAVTGTIFNLKNNFGWKDKTEQELTGADGGPIQTKTLTVVGVEPDTDPE